MKSQIKVLHLTTDSHIGGAEHLLCWLAKYYDRDQFQMAFCTVKPRGALQDRLMALEQPVFDLQARHFWQLGCARRRLRRLVADFAPDIVHTHLLLAGLMGLGVGFRGQPSRLVHSRHYAGFFRVYGSPIQKLLDRYLVRLSSRFIAVSQAVRDDLVHRLGVPGAQVDQIYNGIDFQWLRDQTQGDLETPLREFDQRAGRPRIGVIGNFHPCKGQEVLIAAAPKILEAFPAAHFVLVGNGARKNVLQSQVHQNHLDSCFHFTGFIHSIPQAIRLLDLLVVPSFSEGFGLVACEAMALGVPVLASAVDGLKEILDVPQNGWLFEVGKSEHLAKEAIEILTNSAERNLRIENAEKFVQEKFNVQDQVRNYEALYRSMACGDSLLDQKVVSL